MAKVKAGDRVEWQSHGGTAEGKVVKKVTERTKVKSHTVAATKDDPQFIVETDEGKRAAHKPGALKKA
jgi:plastocyanin